MDEVSLGLSADLVGDRKVRVARMQTEGTVRIKNFEHDFQVTSDSE